MLSVKPRGIQREDLHNIAKIPQVPLLSVIAKTLIRPQLLFIFAKKPGARRDGS
jgi:hypothetical protein